jgi:hypothetical protein
MRIMPHPRKTQVQDQEIQCLPTLETTCNTGFLLPSLQESVTVWLLSLYVHSFKSFVVMWVEASDTPLWKAKRCKDFLRLASNQTPSSNFTSAEMWLFVFSYFLALNLSFKIFPLFCILFIYMALLMQDIFLQNSHQHSFHDECVSNVLQMNTLCSTSQAH